MNSPVGHGLSGPKFADLPLLALLIDKAYGYGP